MEHRLFREKLKWRSIRRSMLEVDLHLTKFIDRDGLDQLDIDELYLYEQILELPDNELLRLLQGSSMELETNYKQIFRKIEQIIK